MLAGDGGVGPTPGLIAAEELLTWRRGQLQQGGSQADFEWLLEFAGGLGWSQLQRLRLDPGQPVSLRVAFKPTSSILTPVETITRDGQSGEIRTKGRHDPCVGIRGVPVVEAMMALVLADQKLMHRAQTGR